MIHLNYHVTLLALTLKRTVMNLIKFDPETYAKACIVLQPYQNLFDINSAFCAGTIFKDLYSPYCAIKYSKEAKK